MNRERGIMMVFLSGTLAMLMVLGYASLARTSHESQLSRWSADWSRALGLAEASLDQSIKQLHVGNFSNVSSTALGGGTMWADVTATGGPLEFLIQGHGLYESAPRNLEAIAQLTQTSVFEFALFGNQQVTVSGDVVTDSYNSAQGAYTVGTASDNGDIGTNSTATGGIVINGNLVVNGQVVVGPDVSDPSTVVTISGGSAVITGSPQFVGLTSAMPMPPVTVPAGVPCSNLTINGGSPTTLLSSVGVYCFHNLKVGGGATLTADGPVTVYITGQFDAGGNSTVGVVSQPKDFLMLVTSTQQATIESSLTGTTQFYGGLYAPNTTIQIDGNARIFGSVIAQRVDVPGNAQIHYDESLGTLIDPPGFYRVKIMSWREP